MATQIIDMDGPQGETGVNIHVFPIGSDTQDDAQAATEGPANRLGNYRASFTDLSPGPKRFELRDGSTLLWTQYGETTSDDNQVFQGSESPPTTIAYSMLAQTVQGLVEDNCPEHSMGTLILAMLESARSGTDWTIRKVGGATKVTKTIAVDASADPVVSVT